MSETKTPWTPGPWEVEEDQDGPPSNVTRYFWISAKAGKAPVHSDWAVLKEADAHLIASAPSLYEALEEAKEALGKIRACSVAGAEHGYLKPELWGEALYGSHADVHYAIGKIDAAIALAKGETK